MPRIGRQKWLKTVISVNDFGFFWFRGLQPHFQAQFRRVLKRAGSFQNIEISE